MSDSKKRFKVFLPLLISLILALGIFLGYNLHRQSTYSQPSSHNQLLTRISNLIRLKYVDSVQIPKLNGDAIQGMLNHLDPHSVYIPPKELAGVEEEMKGSFDGIGVSYYIIRDTINITQVIPKGPAEKAGLAIGDKIIKAGDSVMAGVHISTAKIQKLLRGKSKSKVQLTLLRKGHLLTKTIERGIIPLKSIDAAYMIRPNVAYIRINRFSDRTYGEFMDAITGLKKNHTISKLIIDLRGNPGGIMKQAVNIADELLSGAKMVVYTKGEHYPRQNFTCNKTGEFEEGPLAILVNGRSASASEILAGAIQDWDRGYIIGRQTYGKGLVQEQYRLGNGSALRLTVARYYLPSGRLIQRPYKHRMKEYDHDLLERYRHGEMMYADSIHFRDTAKYYTHIKHRLVHGGGGIMPDVFVPLDTAKWSIRLMDLYDQHILFQFAYRYLNRHEQALSKFKTVKDFMKAPLFSPAILASFKKFAKDKHVSSMDQLTPSDFSQAELQIKAFIARELWQEQGYYEVMNQQDNTINKALEILKQEPKLTSLPKKD